MPEKPVGGDRIAGARGSVRQVSQQALKWSLSAAF